MVGGHCGTTLKGIDAKLDHDCVSLIGEILVLGQQILVDQTPVASDSGRLELFQLLRLHRY